MLERLTEEWPRDADSLPCVVVPGGGAPQFGRLGFGHLHAMVSGESGVLVGEAGKNQPLEGTPALQEGGWITPGQVIWLSYQRSGPIIWLSQLDDLVETRKREMPKDSYTTKLFNRGSEYIAQKLVEESGETAIAAVAQSKEQFLEEASDLMFHLLVLLHERGMNLATLSKHLEGRHR